MCIFLDNYIYKHIILYKLKSSPVFKNLFTNTLYFELCSFNSKFKLGFELSSFVKQTNINKSFFQVKQPELEWFMNNLVHLQP